VEDSSPGPGREKKRREFVPNALGKTFNQKKKKTSPIPPGKKGREKLYVCHGGSGKKTKGNLSVLTT